MMRTGSAEPRPRSALRRVRPSPPGSPRSSSSSSNGSLSSARSAAAVSRTQSTATPSRLRPAQIASPIMESSSTRSSRISVREYDQLHPESFTETQALSPSERLARDAALLGVTLTPADAGRLLALLDELERWNRSYNLTAIASREQMITHHLLDSLSISPDLAGERIADVGTGAGFPGLPLALANPARQFSLIDSNGKKVRFVAHAARTLELRNVTAVHSRAEGLRPEV